MKKNSTQHLAQWFVSNVLKRDIDFRFDRQHLKAAKELVNPGKGVEPLDLDVVKWCIEELLKGEFGFTGAVQSLYVVTWGNPPYYKQMLERVKYIPPPYEIRAYDDWVVKYGRKAIDLESWDGVYLGYSHPLERPFRLTPAQLLFAINDNDVFATQAG